MKQDSNNFTPNIENDKQKNNKSIIIGIAIVFGLLGIGFGLYELVVNCKKDEQINILRERINQLENTNPQTINEKTKIKVISSNWSGWSEGYESDKDETFCEIKLHEKCVVKTRQLSNSEGDKWEEEVFSFEITNINTDSIGIHAFQVLSDSENGINLQTDKQDFVIETNTPLILKTPTMDGGDTFTVTLSQD